MEKESNIQQFEFTVKQRKDGRMNKERSEADMPQSVTSLNSYKGLIIQQKY